MDTEVERVHKVTDLDRVLRFLCVGNENGSYHARQKELNREAVDSIDRYFFLNLIGEGCSFYRTVYTVPLSALKYMIRS